VVTLPETITQSETKQEKEEREIVKQKETFPNQTKEKRISTPQRSKSKELEIPSFSNESFKENLLSKIETTTSRSSYKKKTENKRQIEVSKVESSVLEVATSSSDTFIPEWYILLIKNKIKDNWKTSHTLGDRKTTVSFRVSKTGIIDNVSLEISSGNANFDISVLNAVKSTKKLPLFPNEISEPYLDIVIEFNTGG